MPALQDGAATGAVLEMCEVRTALRYVPNPGRLSALCGPLCHDELLGLRRTESHERLDCFRVWSDAVASGLPTGRQAATKLGMW